MIDLKNKRKLAEYINSCYDYRLTQNDIKIKDISEKLIYVMSNCGKFVTIKITGFKIWLTIQRSEKLKKILE